MRTTEYDEGRPSDETASKVPDSTSVAPRRFISDARRRECRQPNPLGRGAVEPAVTDERYTADERWQANFERMAMRAAREPEFYSIAGESIQHRADAIRAGWS